jgi:acetylornithine deacetylase/succinyl-diaminopimelate desuccinylase-like protein
MTGPHEYAHRHALRFRQELVELLRIPSISTLEEHAPDVERAAEWLRAHMEHIGLTARIYREEDYLPLVYGEWLGAGDGAPTVLVYCHYDVQPAEMEDGWTTNPFEPVERDGKIYARGAVDSKSHVIAQLKAVESLLAEGGQAPVNIRLLFEGEEESGSEHIYGFVQQNPDLLRADAIVISDGSHPDLRQPALEYGLRGIVTLEVVVSGPGRDLHSGHYGGNVHNPIQALTEILAQLHDDNGTVTIPGFYDDVRPFTDEERDVLAGIAPWMETEWREVTGAPLPWGEREYRLHERSSVRPTLEINGIAGGFYGQGFKTVLPARALAKISCRLVPDQDPARITEQVKAHIQALTPPTVHSEVRILEIGAPGVVLERDSTPMQAAAVAYEKGWGVKPIYARAGGSVPVVATFQQELDAPIVMMPFGYAGCGAHGPNEHVYLKLFHQGIDTAIHFYDEFARLSQG